MSEYKCPQVRVMVTLHEVSVREFARTWKLAKAMRLPMDDFTSGSLDRLCAHVFSRSRDCMLWMCDRLELPLPAIREPLAPPFGEAAADDYLDHLLDQWRYSLQGVLEQQLRWPQHRTPWGEVRTVGAMLEHAIVHPQRHRLELSELVVARALE